MTNAEYIWNYFQSKGLSDCGIAGLMGNLYAESGLNPKNLQNSYEKKLKMSDEEYIIAVDKGKYSKKKFVNDSAGFGLAQWTYWSRKQALFEFCKARNESIGSPFCSIRFFISRVNYKLFIGIKNLNNSNYYFRSL